MASQNFKETLYAFLLTQGTLTSLIGARIYPGLAPATATLPFITYERVDYRRTKHITGLSAMAEESYQFDTWDNTPIGAETVMLALRDSLDGFRGAGIYFMDVDSIFDDVEEPTEGKTVGIWRHVLNVNAWYVP